MPRTPLPLPPLTDSLILSHPSGLPLLTRRNTEIVFLTYTLTARVHRIAGTRDGQDEDTASEDEDVDGSQEFYCTREVEECLGEEVRGEWWDDREERGERERGLRIMDVVGCDESLAEEFIAAISAALPWPSARRPSSPVPDSFSRFSPSSSPPRYLPPIPILPPRSTPPEPYQKLPPLLASPSVHRRGHTLTGIAFHGSFVPKTKLTFFVALPYLTSTGDTISVEQVWVCIFDNRTILLLRSSGTDRAPLFPYQPRYGAFHALVGILSNTLRYEGPALEHFRNTPPTATSLSTLLSLLHAQHTLLRDLAHIFQPSGCKIPGIHGEKEQMMIVRAEVDALIQERERMVRVVETWRRDWSAGVLERQMTVLEKGERVLRVIAVLAMWRVVAGYYRVRNPRVKTLLQFWVRAGPAAVLVALWLWRMDGVWWMLRGRGEMITWGGRGMERAVGRERRRVVRYKDESDGEWDSDR